MLKKQIFKTFDGAQRRAAFERAHSDYEWAIVRCYLDGTPDTAPFLRGGAYAYRLLRGPKKSKEVTNAQA